MRRRCWTDWYLTYTGTIKGFERVIMKGRPLATRASMTHRLLTFVVVGFRPFARWTKDSRSRTAEGLTTEQVLNEIGAKLAAMDAVIAKCEGRFRAPRQAARPSDPGPAVGGTVENASRGARTASSETASPASRNGAPAASFISRAGFNAIAVKPAGSAY